jgi:hypothetical protein
MNSLPFKKFKKKLNERRYGGPEKGSEYKKLSPKMKVAINDVYAMINKAPDPIVSKIDGIIKTAAKKHGVKSNDIEDYFDNELIK